MPAKKIVVEKVAMPYNVDLSVAEAIIDNLGRVTEGMGTKELFKRVAAKNKPLKSTSLTLCRFLGFVEGQGRNVKLTRKGLKYFHTNKAHKKEFLAKNLPEKYYIILGWIKNNDGTMSLNEIQQVIIDNWGTPPKDRVFWGMLNTFANFCDTIGVVKYIKGAAGRCTLTPLGYEILSSAPDQEIIPLSNIEDNKLPIKRGEAMIPNEEAKLEGDFPIIILTKNEKPFNWDIKTELDWDVVEGVIKSIKERWKLKTQPKEETHIKEP